MILFTSAAMGELMVSDTRLSIDCDSVTAVDQDPGRDHSGGLVRLQFAQ